MRGYSVGEAASMAQFIELVFLNWHHANHKWEQIMDLGEDCDVFRKDEDGNYHLEDWA